MKMTQNEAQLMIEDILDYERGGEVSEARKYSKKRAEIDAILAKRGTVRLPSFDKNEYPPIRGMEGPFRFRDGRILYYDPRKGRYYDRKTDMYLAYDDIPEDIENDDSEGVDELSEAESVSLDQIGKDQKKIVDMMKKHGFTPVSAHVGIHGTIVDLKVTGGHGMRIYAPTIKQLAKGKGFRWIEVGKSTISIGI